MWTLNLKDLGDLDATLDTALTPANGIPVYAISAAERSAIHAVYQLYDAMLGQPHPNLRPAILDPVRPVVANAYNQVQIGGRLASLRAHLLASVLNCPYCGFGEPRDLDHYLPRSIYGELAIYPNNLVPSCNPCNNAKRTVVPGVGPAHGPSLIHAYFQALPDVDFLVADVIFENGVLLVSFSIDPAPIGPILAAKLQFQLDRLKLHERYPKQINKFLSEQRTGILVCREQGEAVLNDLLARSATSLSKKFGRNDWRAALYRALSSCPEFCDEPQLYLGEE